MRKISTKWLSQHSFLWLIAVMLILGLVLSILSPVFFTVNNISNLLKQVSIIAILGAGQTLAILSAGIDLSVGSMLAFTAVMIGGLIVNLGLNPVVSALIGLLIATTLGMINGFVISKGKIPPFIVTLGMMGIARGFALVYTKGASFQIFEPFFDFIGSGSVLGLPVPILIVLLVTIVLHLVLKHTVFGRNVYSIGDNEDASILAGINVDFHKIIIYGISGLCAGIAAIIMIGRLASAPPNVSQGAELNAIAAVIIGGTSFTGGIGGVNTTIIGAFIMAMITNGLNILGVSSFYQQVFIGVIIILAVWLDRLRSQKK